LRTDAGVFIQPSHSVGSNDNPAYELESYGRQINSSVKKSSHWFEILALAKLVIHHEGHEVYFLRVLRGELKAGRGISERCKLDLPGFQNLEGLHIGMFLAIWLKYAKR
jgi:hypothetical protein